MKIATWNVNSLNVRLDHVLSWLEKNPVDVLALQETKLPDERFPVAALAEAGYHAVFSGQKTYNGVALVTRETPTDIIADIPDFADAQKRVLAATVNGVRIISVYCPNGSALDSPKFDYKRNWFSHLRAWIAEELNHHDQLIVAGDYNVAPRPEDTHDPDKWEGRILCSADERAAFNALLETGLTDCWRLFDDREGRHRFTWWDYRGGGWPQNHGLRIDHMLASPKLAKQCSDCHADVGERGRKRPSDHVPVIAEFG